MGHLWPTRFSSDKSPWKNWRKFIHHLSTLQIQMLKVVHPVTSFLQTGSKVCYLFLLARKSGNFQTYSNTRVKFNLVSKYLWIFIRRWSHVSYNINLKHTFSFVVDESVCSLQPLAGNSFSCIVKTKLHLVFAFSRRGRATCNTVRLRKRSREPGLLRGNPENDGKYAKRIAFQLVNSLGVY